VNPVQTLVDALRRIDGSSFDPVKEAWIDAAEKRYPGMPEDLRDLYHQLGYGRIGNSRYMIHAMVAPGDIYDEETADSLRGVIVVGDDFAGTCEAYDAAHGWVFGSIGSDGRFERNDKCRSLVEFLLQWYGDKAGG